MTEVDYDLNEAHPEYKRLLPQLFGVLVEMFPDCPLRRVTTYEPQPGNRSLGNADEPGVVKFNLFWFARPVAALAAAARNRHRMTVAPGIVLDWHGTMVDEPAQVVAHEFGHVISAVIDGWDGRAKALWERSTCDPVKAPSAYALTNASEHWAEMFAEYALGLSPPSRTRLVEDVLRGIEHP